MGKIIGNTAATPMMVPDWNQIVDSVSAEIEAELNSALDEILVIQENYMFPDGDEVSY